MTQSAFNFKKLNTTKKYHFFTNFKKKFNLFKQKLSHVLTQLTIKKAATFKTIHSNIVKMQQKFTIYQKKNEKQCFN